MSQIQVSDKSKKQIFASMIALSTELCINWNANLNKSAKGRFEVLYTRVFRFITRIPGLKHVISIMEVVVDFVK